MTSYVHRAAFALSLIALGCGGGVPKEAEHPKIDAIFERQASHEGVYVHL